MIENRVNIETKQSTDIVRLMFVLYAIAILPYVLSEQHSADFFIYFMHLLHRTIFLAEANLMLRINFVVDKEGWSV